MTQNVAANATPTGVLERAPLPQSSEVLLLVDFINPLNFPGARSLLPGAWEAAQRAARLKQRLARKGVAVIYANDNYGTWHSDFRDILQACCALKGRRGDISRLLAPKPCDLTVLKPQHSAFHATPLQHVLSAMGTRKLVIAGLAADMCVLLTATDARMAGYDVWVPQDCTAAESAVRKSRALDQLRDVFKCSVRPSVRPGVRSS